MEWIVATGLAGIILGVIMEAMSHEQRLRDRAANGVIIIEGVAYWLTPVAPPKREEAPPS